MLPFRGRDSFAAIMNCDHIWTHIMRSRRYHTAFVVDLTTNPGLRHSVHYIPRTQADSAVCINVQRLAGLKLKRLIRTSRASGGMFKFAIA